MNNKAVFLVGTRWFGVLGPCQLIIDRLVSEGFKVYVFGQSDEHYQRYHSGKAELVRLNVRRSYFSPLQDVADIVKLLFYILLKRPSSVHSFNPKPSLLCYFSLLFVRNTNFFVGVTGLGNTFIKAKKMEGIVKYFLSKASRRADYLFFQNPDDIEVFKSKIGVTEDKVMMFPGPGVDLRCFYIKEQYQQAETLKVLLVARLLWQKGVDDFVAAFEKVRDLGLGNQYKFTLVGDVDLHHPDRLKDEDVKRITDLGIEWIKWTDDVQSVYRDNDLLLFMSKREGGPRAVLEASAVGMPTIGSNCTGVRELINDGGTGYIVDSGDIDAIVDKLEKYRRDYDLLVRHGRAARKEIAEKLSLENATNAQLKMYSMCRII